MHRILFASLALALSLSVGQLQASLISNAIAIPDSEVIINHNGTGLDWAYAGPVAPGEFGPGQIEAPSYRAGEGWRFATAAEWAIKPQWQDFTKPGQAIPAAQSPFTDHSVYRFTSEYWSTFTHVDLSDAASGFITNGFDIGNQFTVPETWYVRTSRQIGTVPEPTSLALWGIGVSCLGFRLRRRSASN